jgi:hypothetical protein
MASALLLLCSRVVLTRLDAAQSDVALATFFVCALYFGRINAASASSATLAAGLLSSMVMPGLKMSGWIYLIIALSVSMLWQSQARKTRTNWPRIASIGAAAMGVLLGGYWYARNVALSGNPLGFVRIELAGMALLQGDTRSEELARTTLLRLFDPTRLEHWRVLASGLWDQLGPSLLVFLGALPALLALRRRGRPATRGGLLGVAIAAAMAALAYLATPYSADNGEHGLRFTEWFSVNLRFAFSLLALLALLSGVALRVVPSAWLLAATALALLYVMNWQLQVAATAAAWSASLAFCLTAALMLRRRPGDARTVSLRVLALLLGACTIGSIRLPGLLQLRERLRIEEYGLVYEFLQREVPHDATIGYLGTHRVFPLFGDRLARRVVGLDASLATSAEWERELRARGVTYLAVGATSSAREQVRAHPESFELLFTAQSQRKDVELCRVR